MKDCMANRNDPRGSGASGPATVPAGKYALQIWQEALGTTSREVSVGAEDTHVTVEFKARR